MEPFTDNVVIPPSRRMRLDERAGELARLPLFAGCSKRHLRALARLSRQVTVEPGAALFSEGSPSAEAYVIVAGRAEVREDGEVIATLGPGEFVGELGLLLDRPRKATVLALSPLDTVAISRSALREAVNETPDLGWLLLETVAHRLST